MENKHTRSVSLIDGHTEEMTDAEIIKALEICNSTKKGHCLNRCPYYNYSANCMQSMINDALDLINRQKAEIEKLEKIERFATKTIEKQDAEIERLQKVADLPREGFFTLLCGALVYTKTIEEYNKFRKTIKSEAIKEFAEKLKERRCGNTYPYVLLGDIDNLVKEMTEGKENV